MAIGIAGRFTPRCMATSLVMFLIIFLVIHFLNDANDDLIYSSNEIITPLFPNKTNLPKSSTSDVDMKSYAVVLEKYASKENWIVLALIDQGCRDMAINFYETSLKKFGIKNYLFIGSDRETCSDVIAQDINCYVYKVDKDGGKASVYHSKDFLRKMNIRTYMILDALNLGFNVLHTDVDMSFFKNPFSDFDYKSIQYDVAPLWDCGAYNAGFLFIRNIAASRAMYMYSKKIADTEPKTDDQVALNRAIAKSKKSHGLKVSVLPKSKYLCGRAFFEDTKRIFPGDHPCTSCVVIHNNWIVSMEAKTFRIKEMHMWMYDVDGYYTNPNRKYLYFENPVKFPDPKTSAKEEINSLMNAVAIGDILNRTVIYPRFHCGKGGGPCILINHLLIRRLISVYPNYRESTFLQHPKVPKSISEVQSSKTYVILSQGRPDMKIDKSVAILNPKDLKRGATNEEIVAWFGSNKDPVLRFHSLYNAFCCYANPGQDKIFQEKMKKAIKTSGYRQFK